MAKKVTAKKRTKKNAKGQFVRGSLKQIGVLTLAQNDDTNGFFQLRKELRENFKDVEGKDFSLHFRFANGDNSKLSALAAELLQIPVEVIITGGTRATKEVLALNPAMKVIQAVGGEDPGGPNRTGFYLDVVTMCTGQVTELKAKNITDLTILYNGPSQAKNHPDPYTQAVVAATGLNLSSINVGDFADLTTQLTSGTVFTSADPNVVAGFMLIPNGMFFDHCITIAQTVEAAMLTRPNTWAIYPEQEFKDVHSPSTKSRVIVSGSDVVQAYIDTAQHVHDHLKGNAMKPSKKAKPHHDP
jgi:hypothetical protein